jgi:hypothetical protein
MIIKIPSFETLEKVNRFTKSSYKAPVGWKHSSPVRDLAAAVFPKLGVAALTQRATSG